MDKKQIITRLEAIVVNPKNSAMELVSELIFDIQCGIEIEEIKSHPLQKKAVFIYSQADKDAVTFIADKNDFYRSVSEDDCSIEIGSWSAFVDGMVFSSSDLEQDEQPVTLETLKKLGGCDD